jgi:hypothetical protein
MPTSLEQLRTPWPESEPNLDPTDRRLAGWLGLVLALNLTDGALTLHVVQDGLGWERNPLMRALLTEGSSYFLGVKLLVCGLALALLWFARRDRKAHLVAALAAIVYGAVVGYTVLNLVR